MNTQTLTIVNPDDHELWDHAYDLCFGAYGSTHLLAFADNIGDALDECVDWIADNAPGLLADEQVNDEYNAQIALGLPESEAIEIAEQDTTCAGNCGHYLLSYEWGLSQTTEGGPLVLTNYDLASRLAYALPHVPEGFRNDHMRGLFPNIT